MKANVSEIAPDIYRLSTFHPQFKIQFDQFLIKDDEPFLMHTGFKKIFPATLEGVASVIDPSSLRQTLLCSDLFFHPGEVEPLIESGVVDRAGESIIRSLSSPLGNDMPYTANTSRILQRLADLMPRTLALMHGSSFRGDGQRAIMDLSAVINDTLGKSEKV